MRRKREVPKERGKRRSNRPTNARSQIKWTAIWFERLFSLVSSPRANHGVFLSPLCPNKHFGLWLCGSVRYGDGSLADWLAGGCSRMRVCNPLRPHPLAAAAQLCEWRLLVNLTLRPHPAPFRGARFLFAPSCPASLYINLSPKSISRWRSCAAARRNKEIRPAGCDNMVCSCCCCSS